jgi:hypothetical protein
MASGSTTLAGIEIPSTDPIFLTVVAGIHIPLGIVCVFVGARAMLSKKQRGRHSTLGRVYFWSLLALFGSATFLSVMRWTEDYHLFVFGAVSFASAWFGRTAQLPVWKVLPAFTYWLLPFAVGMPIIVWALLRHPVLDFRTPRLLARFFPK